MGPWRWTWILPAMFLAPSCHTQAEGYAGSTTPPAETTPEPTAATTEAPERSPAATATIVPEVEAGVSTREVPCDADADEACNALDDNCNGQIDEGCGYRSGAVQITLFWETPADIDLYVTDPNSEIISYNHDTSASGGHLDQDARGRCGANQEGETIENVYWGENPASGRYKVVLHYFAECASGVGPTTATVSIAAFGRVIGTYEYTLAPNERVELATFVLP